MPGAVFKGDAMTSPRSPTVAEIVAKMRADLDQVGGFENGMIGVPADGIARYIESLEAALRSQPAAEAVAWINSNELVDMATGKLTASLVISARDEGYTAPLYSAPLLADPKLAMNYKVIFENALLKFDKGRDTPAEIVGEAIARCQDISRYTPPTAPTADRDSVIEECARVLQGYIAEYDADLDNPKLADQAEGRIYALTQALIAIRALKNPGREGAI